MRIVTYSCRFQRTGLPLELEERIVDIDKFIVLNTRPLLGYFYEYDVSELGVIYKGGIEVAYQKMGNDFLSVKLYKNKSKRITRYVHNVVADVWLDNPYGFKKVIHKDADKSNNSAPNLEWLTNDNLKKVLPRSEILSRILSSPATDSVDILINKSLVDYINGRDSAFTLVKNKCNGLIANEIRNHGGWCSEEDVDDLIQTTFIRALSGLMIGRYNSGYFRMWIRGIARNACREHRRKVIQSVENSTYDMSDYSLISWNDAEWSLLRQSYNDLLGI